MSKAANPFAFPRHPDHPQSGDYQQADGGMTLRDWFAGQALAGLSGQCDSTGMWSWLRGDAVRTAYELADAMLAERAKGGDA